MNGPRRKARAPDPRLLLLPATVFLVSLGHDIGALAQQPEFAERGRLGIPYLLASHLFEHVLDSVFFTLLALLLAWLPGRERA